MDYLMGIRGKDFIMIVSDTTAVQQIITIKHDEVTQRLHKRITVRLHIMRSSDDRLLWRLRVPSMACNSPALRRHHSESHMLCPTWHCLALWSAVLRAL